MKKFSIIEAVILIGIIAILCAILLPALSSAKKMANQASNINNLKQIGVGMAQYLTEKNSYPYIDSIAYSGDKSKTLWLLLPYVDYNVNVFYPPWSEQNMNNSYLRNPKSLYNTVSSGGTGVPSPGYAYAPTYYSEPLSIGIPDIPIVSNYTHENYDVYYLTSNGSVQRE